MSRARCLRRTVTRRAWCWIAGIALFGAPACGDSTNDTSTGGSGGTGGTTTTTTDTGSTCGDGTVAGTEACDDGNTTDDDGCSGTCTVESGYTCSGAPSVCTST